MKIGDYELNTVHCADSYAAIKTLPDKCVDLIYTDVPYDLEKDGGGGAFGSKKRDYHAEYQKVCDNTEASRVWKSTSKYIDGIRHMAYGIDFSILNEFCRVCKKVYIYIWCSKKQILPLMQYFVGERDCRFEILTWHKTNPIPTCNNKYLSDTEYCLMFREQGTKIGGTMATKNKYYISALNTEYKNLFGHPTMKPLPFVRNHIINSTEPNDIVADFFTGGGTTAVACKDTGRNFLCFEIEQKWVDIANDRLRGITGAGQMSFLLR